MLALELDSTDAAKAAVTRLLAKGILINRTHDTVLRFLPPYIAEKKHVDELVYALDHALADVKGMNRKQPKGSRMKSRVGEQELERSH
jgi:acetylornithine aminotransferase/acetylornithine/N-succinyldiaminopimelate aminotransferase